MTAIILLNIEILILTAAMVLTLRMVIKNKKEQSKEIRLIDAHRMIGNDFYRVIDEKNLDIAKKNNASIENLINKINLLEKETMINAIDSKIKSAIDINKTEIVVLLEDSLEYYKGRLDALELIIKESLGELHNKVDIFERAHDVNDNKVKEDIEQLNKDVSVIIKSLPPIGIPA